MAFDCIVAVYSGVHNTGALLQFLEVDDFQFESNQIGGLGKGSFQARYAFEQSSTRGAGYTTNINSPNRIGAFLRLDQLTAGAVANATTIAVANPARFKVGQSIALWNGVNSDTAAILSISGSVLTLSRAITNGYAASIGIYVLRYSGYISAVIRDAGPDNVTKFETSGYATQMNQRRATCNGGGMESGWVLYNLLQTFSAQWDLVCTPANFTMSSNGALTGGTGIAYNGQQTDTTITSIVNDIILYANSNVAKTQYTIWVDETNSVHFGPLNTTTPTVTVSLLNPTPGFSADGLFDMVSAHQVRDEDLQGLVNVLTVVGGNDGFGNPIKAIVTDVTSIATYGQWEGQISNTGIKTETDAKTWGQSYLAVNAYPRQQSTTALGVVGSFATAQDYIQVNGFVDGTSTKLSVQSVTTQWRAGEGQFSQQIKGIEQFPNINRLISQIAAQHYLASGALADMGSNIRDRFVVSGLSGSKSGGTFTLSAGVLAALTTTGLQNYQIPQYVFTPTADGVYTLAWLYRNADGSQYATPQIVTFAGITVPVGSAYTMAQIVPLYYVYRLGGIITAYDDKRQFGSINLASLLNASYPQPTFSTTPTTSSAIEVQGLATSILVTAPLNNVPQDYGVSRVVWYYRVSGSTAWLPVEETVLSPFPLPAQSQTVSFRYGQLQNGQNYDFAISYVAFGGNVNQSGIATLATNVSAAAVALPTYYQIGGTGMPTVQAGATATPQPSVNNISASVSISFTVTNQPTNGSLSRIGLWVKNSGSANSTYAYYGSISANGVASPTPSATGSYIAIIADLVGNKTYDFGVSYENAQGGESSVADALLNYSSVVITIGNGMLASMPVAIKNAGPNLTIVGSPSLTNTGGGTDEANITYTLNDSLSTAQWFNGVFAYLRVTGSGQAGTPFGPYDNVSPAQQTNNIAQISGMAAGKTYDIGFAYCDLSGAFSTIVYPSATANIVIAAINPPTAIQGSGSGNYVLDAQLAHFYSNWFAYLYDNSNFKVSTGNQYQPYNLFSWTSGSNSTGRYANSQPFTLTAGQTYTASAYINLINALGSGGVRIIGPVSGTITNINPGNTASPVVASLIQSAGISGTKSQSFVPTTTGTYVLQVSNSGISIGGSTPIYMAQFQVESGPTFTGFKQSSSIQADGTLAHTALSTAVQTVVNPGGTYNAATATGTLPYANHDGTIQNGASRANTAIGSNNIVNYSNHAPGVTATVASGGGIDFQYAAHANKHLGSIPDGSGRYAAVTANADQTANATSANTNNVGGISAGAVNGGIDGNSILIGAGASRFTNGSSGANANFSTYSIPIAITMPNVGTWYCSVKWTVSARFLTANSAYVLNAAIGAANGGQVNFVGPQIVATADSSRYCNMSCTATCSLPGAGQQVQFALQMSGPNTIDLRAGGYEITLFRTP